MSSLKRTILHRGFVLIHFLTTVAVFVGCWLLFYRLPSIRGEYFMHNRTICASYFFVLLLLSRVYNCYEIGTVRISDLLFNQFLANLIAWGITYVLACIMAQKLLTPLAGFAALLIQSVFGSAWTMLANRMYFRGYVPPRTVLVYRDQKDREKIESIRSFSERWDIIRRVCCDDRRTAHDLPGVDARPDRIAVQNDAVVVDYEFREMRDLLADAEVVFVAGIGTNLRNAIVKYCMECGKECNFIPHTGDVITEGATHMRSLNTPVCQVKRCALAPEYAFVKRFFDVLFSALMLIVVSPLMLITAIAIKQYDKGPVFYKQVRWTKDKKEFEIIKFRSMRVDSEKDGVARLAAEHDDRITPIGRVIRAIRFDELPQLINILRGDMSIVGPRPERPEIARAYAETLPAFDLRLQVRAGLTGYAQVYGKYNTEPADKLKMDLMYINHIGIVEDLKLMFATVRILFSRESTEGFQTTRVPATSLRARKELRQKAI